MVEVEPNSFPGIRIIMNYYPNPAIIPSEQAKLSNIQFSGDFYTDTRLYIRFWQKFVKQKERKTK